MLVEYAPPPEGPRGTTTLMTVGDDFMEAPAHAAEPHFSWGKAVVAGGALWLLASIFLPKHAAAIGLSVFACTVLKKKCPACNGGG